MTNSLEDKLKELKIGYLRKLETTILEFDNFLECGFDISTIYSKVHTISGTSGMYGLKELSDISTQFEIYLKEKKDNASKINEKELNIKFKKYVEDIKKFLAGE